MMLTLTVPRPTRVLLVSRRVDKRDDLIEIGVTAHLDDVLGDVRGDINATQSPADGCCALAVLVEPSSCLLPLEMNPR